MVLLSRSPTRLQLWNSKNWNTGATPRPVSKSRCKPSPEAEPRVTWPPAALPPRSCHRRCSGSSGAGGRSGRWRTTSSVLGFLWSPRSCTAARGSRRLYPRLRLLLNAKLEVSGDSRGQREKSWSCQHLGHRGTAEGRWFIIAALFKTRVHLKINAQNKNQFVTDKDRLGRKNIILDPQDLCLFPPDRKSKKFTSI